MIIVFLFFFAVCISIFMICYVVIYIFFEKRFELVKNNLYLIIPIYCILCWALYYVVLGNFFAYVCYDFTNYYFCGERVLNNPKDLYDHNISNGRRYGYKYLPNHAIIIGVPLYLLGSMELAYRVFYVINIVLGMLFILLFNRILILMELKNKVHRFLFLIVISNGWLILELYINNQMKFLIGVLILFIIKRELKYRKNNKKKDLKYYIIHYNFFALIVAMAPYFILFFLIYLFQGISKNEIFSKNNLKKYGSAILTFFVHNFLFILYPVLIYDYYEMVQKDTKRNDLKLKHFYLEYLNENILFLPSFYEGIISTIFNLILYAIVLILIVHRRLKLEQKAGIYCLSVVILNYISYRILIIILPITCLLFVPFLYQNETGKEFIKKNRYVLIGLLSILGIYIVPHSDRFHYPYIQGIGLAYFFLVIILGSICLILFLKRESFLPKEEQIRSR